MSQPLRRGIGALSICAFTIVAGCGSGLATVGEEPAETVPDADGIGGIAYCPDSACASTDPCCSKGTCGNSPTICVPVPSTARAPIRWWSDSRKTFQSGVCGGYDTDNGNIGSGNTITLPHDSEYLGDNSDTGDYNNSKGAWGFGPTFYDTVTRVKFHLNHIKPGSPLAKVPIGTILKAGSYVGRSGGDTCETGYCSTGYPFATCLTYLGANAGTCPLEGGGTGHCAIARSCASSASAAAHLCVVMDGSDVAAAFCPTSTTPGCGSSAMPTCTTCGANDSQCHAGSYGNSCNDSNGTCTDAGCCCPTKRLALSGSFLYCCPVGTHYGALLGGGAGCVADQPDCSANDSECTSYGSSCGGGEGACTSVGCCCPTARTCQTGSFPYCCAEGTHCGTLSGGGQGCIADLSMGGGCTPACAGRTCGSDPNECATSCGSCQPGWTCSETGTCVPPPPACPTGVNWHGAGQYCYFQPGMTNTAANHLYSCSAPGALASDLGNCGEGCRGMPPGQNDLCYAAYCPTGSYWYGAGLYCGHGPGMANANPDIVYYCSGPGAKGSVSQRCSGACVVAPPGVNDHC